MTERPGRLVLLGHPVAHSLSPRFQNAALRALDIPLRYEALDVAPAALGAVLGQMRAERAAGNVTVPHKEAAAARCDRLTDWARAAGAVNVFWTEDGALVGDNTDVGGVAAAVRALMHAEPRNACIALIGAGGAAAAVAVAAGAWEGCTLLVANRTRQRAEALAHRFGTRVQVVDGAAVAARGAQLVVNATTIGMDGVAHPVPLNAIAGDAFVLDLVYRPGGTAWVRAARGRGLHAQDGTAMLVEQGALAFERWFGVPAPRDVMRQVLGGAP